MNTKLLVSDAEASKLLGISRSKFRRMDSTGDLGPSAIKLGHLTKWRHSEIVDWVDEGCVNREKWRRRIC